MNSSPIVSKHDRLDGESLEEAVVATGVEGNIQRPDQGIEHARASTQ